MNLTQYLQPVLFYCFSAMLLLSGLMVILARNPVKSALFLVLGFFASAGLWMLLEAEFLALVLVLVYVGAVMTLFLFVLMMLRLDSEHLKWRVSAYLPIAVLIAVALVGLLITVFGPQHFSSASKLSAIPHPESYSNTAALGNILYTHYSLQFELAGCILLLAIIAAIGLVFRGHRNRLTQDVSKQISVDPSQRLRIIKDMGKD